MWNLQGSTIWARQTLESDIFYKKPDKWFKIWFFLVNRVNHKDNKQFKRAECFTTYTEIGNYTGAKVHQIENCIKWLKSATMITTQKATRGMLIYVLNFAKFQDAIKTKSHTESHDKSQTEATQKPDRSHTINNNDNNDKNEKNNTADIKSATSLEAELIQYWIISWSKVFTKREKPIIANWGRYVKQAKPFINAYGLEKCKTVCDKYFLTMDKFYQSNNWALNIFLTDGVFNKLV